jgi:hypothetical protein
MAELIGANEARLNITWQGNNGDLPDPVANDAADGDLFQWASEAVRGGGVPGIPADPNVRFEDFVVRRFGSTPDVPFNRIMIHPKTPFGSEYTHCSKCRGEKDSEGWCPNYCLDDE